jgi:hypothetical protein
MGRTALKARLTLEAQRPFIQPQPGKRPCPSLRRTPRRAAAQPARRHRRWQRPWLALGCSSARASSFSPLQGKHKARRPAALGRRHARDAAWRACALASAGGEAVAMARVGAAGQLSRSPAPATNISRHEGRFNTGRDAPPRRLAQTRRGVDGVPCTPGRPAFSRAPATAGRHGPVLALGCAGSATVSSLLREPKRHHGQDIELEARRALGAGLDGAARGCPQFP